MRFAILYSSGWFGNDKKVLLTNVDVLTLYANKYTTSGRGSPIPQLTCVGGTARGQFVPQVVQCYNRGTDGVDVQVHDTS